MNTKLLTQTPNLDYVIHGWSINKHFLLVLGSSYYMPPHQGAVSAAAAASSSMHSQFGGASMHHMAAPFGSSFGGMVRIFHKKYFRN